MDKLKYLDEVIDEKGHCLIVDMMRYSSGPFGLILHSTETVEEIASCFTDGDDDADIVDSFYGRGNPISLFANCDSISEVFEELEDKARRIVIVGWSEWTDIGCYVREEYKAAVEKRLWEHRRFSPILQATIDDFKKRMDAVESLKNNITKRIEDETS